MGSSLAECRMPVFRSDCLFQAFHTRTFSPQKFPRINAAAVAVVPMEVDGILAHGCDLQRTRGLLIHRQRARLRPGRHADFASSGFALFVAGGTGTSVAQPS